MSSTQCEWLTACTCAGHQAIHQLVNAASAFAPWPAARPAAGAAAAAVAPQSQLMPPAASRLPPQPSMGALQPSAVPTEGPGPSATDRHLAASSLRASGDTRLQPSSKPAKACTAPRRIVSGQSQAVHRQGHDGHAHPLGPLAGKWVGANHPTRALCQPQQRSTRDSAAAERQTAGIGQHHTVDRPPAGLQSALEHEPQAAGQSCSKQTSLPRPSLQDDSQLTASDGVSSVQTPSTRQTPLQHDNDTQPVRAGQASAKQNPLHGKTSQRHDWQPVEASHHRSTSLARLQSLQKADLTKGPGRAKVLQPSAAGISPLHKKVVAAAGEPGGQESPAQVKPWQHDSPPVAASAFRRVEAHPAKSQALQPPHSPPSPGDPLQSRSSGLNFLQGHLQRSPLEATPALSEGNPLLCSGSLQHDSPLGAVSPAATVSAVKSGHPLGSTRPEVTKLSRLEQLASAGPDVGTRKGVSKGYRDSYRKAQQQHAKEALRRSSKAGALQPQFPPSSNGHQADQSKGHVAHRTPTAFHLRNGGPQAKHTKPDRNLEREFLPHSPSHEDITHHMQSLPRPTSERSQVHPTGCSPVAATGMHSVTPHSSALPRGTHPGPPFPRDDDEEDSGSNPVIAPCKTPSPPHPHTWPHASKDQQGLPTPMTPHELDSQAGMVALHERWADTAHVKPRFVSVGTQTDSMWCTAPQGGRRKWPRANSIPSSPGFKVTTRTKNEIAQGQGPPCKLTSSLRGGLRSLRYAAGRAGQQLPPAASGLQQRFEGNPHPPTPPHSARYSLNGSAPSASPAPTSPHRHSGAHPIPGPMAVTKKRKGHGGDRQLPPPTSQQPPATVQQPPGPTHLNLPPSSPSPLPAAAPPAPAALPAAAATAACTAKVQSPPWRWQPRDLKWGTRKRRNTGSAAEKSGGHDTRAAPGGASRDDAPPSSSPMDAGCMTPEDGRGSTGDSDFSTIPRGPHDV